MNPRRQQLWDAHGEGARLALESSGIEDGVVLLVDPLDKQGASILRSRGERVGLAPVTLIMPRDEAEKLLSFAPKTVAQIHESPGPSGAYAVVISAGALVIRLGPDV